MNIVIRKETVDDAEKVIDINIEVWNTTYKDLIPQEVINRLQFKDKERIEKEKKDVIEKNDTFVAEVNGEVIGYSKFGKSRDKNYSDSGEIYAAYILDKYQGLGIGRKLVVCCMKELLDEGYKTMITKCLEGNSSNRFHRSIGGVMVGQCECYLGQRIIKPSGLYIGKENIYYHNDLENSLKYNNEIINK